MSQFRCFLGGKKKIFIFSSIKSIVQKTPAAPSASIAMPMNFQKAIANSLKAQASRLKARFHEVGNEDEVMASTNGGLVATETMIVNEASVANVNWLRDRYGMEVVQEGRFGKLLLQSPEGGQAGVKIAFEASCKLVETGKAESSHPNFLRWSPRPNSASTSGYESNWGINNPGDPGKYGADVHGLAAWTISQGAPGTRIAVLDEGVDTKHPWLKSAVVDEADFVDDNNHAMPDNNDAHGTACAGIIFSQHKKVQGLAPKCQLVAVRIAKSDVLGKNWIIDDFDTADAIDWSWKEGRSSVLSNSWSGGMPTDAITNAIERARTQGRNGKGAVVIFAAGNLNVPIYYPSNLPGILTVGASNQWDERKSPTSKDGEHFWGSNYGPCLDLLAPGVGIATTDIRGAKGYSDTLFYGSFNGTSSATPHVAAVAGLILSIRQDLTEADVRKILIESTDPIAGQAGRTDKLGHGRLNAYNALRLAKRYS
ncbi:MAG: S8 family serine peptidase [Planctomycetota bacterium]